MNAGLFNCIVCLMIFPLAVLGNFFKLRKEELETRLRMAEMEAGFPPGTYSGLSKKERKKAHKSGQIPSWSDIEKLRESRDEEAERKELLEGIASRKSRIDNRDTIMKEKRK